MSNTADICDHRVDAFVAAVNSSPREELFQDEVPPECVISVNDECVEWRIVPSNGALWLPELEASLPFRLPRTFRSLIARYLRLLKHHRSLCIPWVRDAETTGEEMRLAIFADKFMSPFLLSRGLLPFARPEDWSYDPVCFDFRTSNQKSEPAVVRIDHEEILCNERLRVIETISPAFHELLEEMTGAMKAKSKTT